MTNHDHDTRQARAEGASSAEVREAQRRLREAERAERLSQHLKTAKGPRTEVRGPTSPGEAI